APCQDHRIHIFPVQHGYLIIAWLSQSPIIHFAAYNATGMLSLLLSVPARKHKKTKSCMKETRILHS
ncbi:MAG: hypothetical protein WC299_08980, partial [Kiritimatiellia bacterium]